MLLRIVMALQREAYKAVRASKIMSDGEKDAHDIAEIDRIGYDLDRYARIAKEYATMRIVCVAHGE